MKRAVYYREPDVERLVLEKLGTLYLPPDVMELVGDALRMISREIWAQSERDRDRLQALDRRSRKQIATAYDDRVKGRLQASMFEELSEGWQMELEDVRNQLSSIA